MPDDPATSIELSEYEMLRAEVTNRTTLAYGLIALELAALGAGASVIDKFPDVLIALAAVSCFLWLFWVDHAGQVYKIAGYVGVVVSPHLSAASGRTVLGWERFLRVMEDPRTTRQALPMLGPHDSAYVQRATAADWYTALLFGLAPPLLTTAYIATAHHVNHRLGTRVWVEVALVAPLWALALWRFINFKRTVATIGVAIIGAGAERPAGDASATT